MVIENEDEVTTKDGIAVENVTKRVICFVVEKVFSGVEITISIRGSLSFRSLEDVTKSHCIEIKSNHIRVFSVVYIICGYGGLFGQKVSYTIKEEKLCQRKKTKINGEALVDTGDGETAKETVVFVRL